MRSIKNFNFYLCLLLVTIVFLSGSYDINGKGKCNLLIELTNIPDSTYLYLIDNETNRTSDSIMIMQGKGKYKVNLKAPSAFCIENYDFTNRKYEQIVNRQYKYLWLENSDIKLSGDFNNLRNAKVEGSVSDKISNQYLTLQDNYGTVRDSLNKVKNETKDTLLIKDINKELSDRKEKFRIELIDYFKQNNNTPVILMYLTEQCIYNNLSKKEILDIFNNFPGNIKKHKTAKEIKHFTTLPEVPRIGDKYIDFVQFTPNGDTIRLSKHLGKFTLLEFWGSGCYWCRQENPNLVNIYNKYNPLGLQIIGISNDNKRERWIKAIEEDKLPWINVSDLKAWFNEASLIYGINGIPDNILINSEGIITHKNLRGEELENILSKLLGN